ncbi:MAG: DUF4179 domain-containing protein [Lachnospiraceae bacterium]|nr:DUF4179 domain-containing protein [Lachnospiraceae bacterium]
MRTDEERLAALHKRAAAIEEQRNTRRTWIVTSVAMIASLGLLVLVGLLLPGLLDPASSIGQDPGMTASILTESSVLGFVVIGVLAFVLGVLVTVLCYRLKTGKANENTHSRTDSGKPQLK